MEQSAYKILGAAERKDMDWWGIESAEGREGMLICLFHMTSNSQLSK